MPRGVRKPIDYEEELQKIDMQITRWQNTIKELQEKKRELLEQKQQQEMKQIYVYMQENNLSSADLLARIQTE